MDEDGDSNSLLVRFARLFGGRPEIPGHVKERVIRLLSSARAEGLISSEEEDMIGSILEFKDTLVREIMVPRTEMAAASVESTAPEIINVIIESGHSRIPIFEHNLDSIVGVVHAKDLLPHWGAKDGEMDLRRIARPAYFVPETKKICDLLKELKAKRVHIAVVIDEYGGTAGLLTVEDIVEEIVGELEDEYDLEEKRLIVIDPHTVLADARLEVEFIEEHFNVDLPEGEFASVGGFVVNLAGRVPETGEIFRYDGLEFLVEAADERKIDSLRVTAVEKSPEDAAQI
ncbi:MAG: hemolysin family protein [Pseudomonadota bacterium]